MSIPPVFSPSMQSHLKRIESMLGQTLYVDEIKKKFGSKVHIRCPIEVNDKIVRLSFDGPNRLQIISDFDRTISTSEYNNKPTMSSFSVFETCASLPVNYRERALELFHTYRPIEDDPSMTMNEKLPYIEEWWQKSESLLKGLQFEHDDIIDSVKKAKVKLRDGVEEVFQQLSTLGIPLIVMSAGIGDVVEAILQQEDLMTHNVSIVSNFLDIDKDSDGCSYIQGFKGEKLIHVFNKNEHTYLDKHSKKTLSKKRINVILMGDSLGDAQMDGHIPFKTVLRIGFLNSDLVTEHDEDYLEQYKQAFDIVLVQDQTMGLLSYLMNLVIENRFIKGE